MAPARASARVLLLVGVLMAAGVVVLLPTRPVLGLTPHAPIYIFTDAGFPGNSGVTGGNGTAGNPYIIAGWDINASAANGIHLVSTTAYFVIRNTSIHSGGLTYSGIYLSNAVHGRIENVTLTSNDYGVYHYGGTVKIVNSVLVNNYGGVRAFSTYTEVNATSVRGSFYGVEADRSSHMNITYSNLNNNTYGVFATSDTHTSIIGNRFRDNGFGAQLSHSRNAVVAGNTFTNDGLTLVGTSAPEYYTHTISTDNLVNGKPLYYYRNCTGTSVSGIPVGQLIFANCTNPRAANLTVTGTDYGVGAYFSAGGWINDSALSSNSHVGLDVYGGAGLSVLRNTVGFNAEEGMTIAAAKGTVLRGNTIRSNANNGVLLSNAPGPILDGNNLSLTYHGVYLWYSSPATLSNNVLWNDSYGIYLTGGNGSLLARNRFSRNLYGLWAESCSNLTLQDNNLSYNGYGAYITGCSRATLLRNSAFSHTVFGISLTTSPSASIRDNRVVASGDGLEIYDSSKATITNNSLLGNGNRGIFVYLSSQVVVNRNNISYDLYGLELYSASYNTVTNNTFYRNTAYGAYLATAYGNLLHHNAFIANAIQAYDSYAAFNAWNLSYPGGGNYWSNYGGVDLCRGPAQTDCVGPDGIGDTPYAVDTDTSDMYPLMRNPSLPNSPPTASFSYSPAGVYNTTTVTFDATASWDYEDAPATLQVRWDWNNDGIWDYPTVGYTTVKTATHRFATLGTYTVKLGVLDSGGLTSTTTRTFTVTLQPLAVSLFADRLSGVAPLAVAFSTNVTGGQGPYSYIWTFGDGTISAEANPHHTYGYPGTYAVTVTVTDSQGHTDTAYTLLTVSGSNPPPGGGFFPTLGNPFLWIPIVAVVAAVVVGVAFVSKRRRRPKGPSGEPPLLDRPLTPPKV